MPLSFETFFEIVYFLYMKQIFALFSLFFVLFISCEARVNGSLSADGSASLTLNMSLYSRTASLIQNLFAAAGQGGQAQQALQVLDGQAISRSMSQAPGIGSVTLRNTSQTAVSGQMQISKISDFLSAAGESGFVTFERRGAAQGGRCRININRGNGGKILELLSPQLTDYLNALMAPVVTEEEISKTEYLELVTSFYNKSIADEITRSIISIVIDFPGTVTSVYGGTFSGRKVTFNIPLLDLLALETPLYYEVVWN